MPATYRNAPDLAELAAPLIRLYHPHLNGWPLRFVWRSEMRKVRGALAAATAEIVSGRFAWFVMTAEELRCFGQDNGPRMFWIEVAEEAWEAFDDRQRLALLDHELSHCVIRENDEGELRMEIAPHDIEEFHSIVDRWGAWRPELDIFDYHLQVGKAKAARAEGE